MKELKILNYDKFIKETENLKEPTETIGDLLDDEMTPIKRVSEVIDLSKDSTDDTEETGLSVYYNDKTQKLWWYKCSLKNYYQHIDQDDKPNYYPLGFCYEKQTKQSLYSWFNFIMHPFQLISPDEAHGWFYD